MNLHCWDITIILFCISFFMYVLSLICFYSMSSDFPIVANGHVFIIVVMLVYKVHELHRLVLLLMFCCFVYLVHIHLGDQLKYFIQKASSVWVLNLFFMVTQYHREGSHSCLFTRFGFFCETFHPVVVAMAVEMFLGFISIV